MEGWAKSRLENNLTTTDTVQELQKKLYQKAKSNAKFRFYALYDKVYRMDVLRKAWANVKANKGCGGIDGQTIEETEQQGLDNLLRSIQRELIAKSYRPQPAKKVYIPKPNGTKRLLSIPTVKDRVAQAALKLILEPIFEAGFEEVSYGFRPNRSAQQAALEVRKYLNFGYKEVIEADIEDCFGSIPHKELLDMVAKRVVDGKILWLIKLFLKAGVMKEVGISRNDKGIPQGGVISPLLANVYLDNLDKEWKPLNNVARLIRYADDLVIITKYKADGYKVKLKQRIEQMKLRLKAEKTQIVNPCGQAFSFLGFSFVRAISKKSNKLTTYYFPSEKTITAIKRKVRQIANYRRRVKAEQIIKELQPVLRGWVNYFRAGNSSRKFSKLRFYVARRVRKFMRRRRQKTGYGYKEYPDTYLYGKLGLYNDYRVCWAKAS